MLSPHFMVNSAERISRKQKFPILIVHDNTRPSAVFVLTIKVSVSREFREAVGQNKKLRPKKRYIIPFVKHSDLPYVFHSFRLPIPFSPVFVIHPDAPVPVIVCVIRNFLGGRASYLHGYFFPKKPDIHDTRPVCIRQCPVVGWLGDIRSYNGIA